MTERLCGGVNQRLPSKSVSAMPRQRMPRIRWAPSSARTRITTAGFFLIAPIWPSSTLSLKPEINEGCRV